MGFEPLGVWVTEARWALPISHKPAAYDYKEAVNIRELTNEATRALQRAMEMMEKLEVTGRQVLQVVF
jgi:hypothetical protein